jgi:hypothetical protein
LLCGQRHKRKDNERESFHSRFGALQPTFPQPLLGRSYSQKRLNRRTRGGPIRPERICPLCVLQPSNLARRHCWRGERFESGGSNAGQSQALIMAPVLRVSRSYSSWPQPYALRPRDVQRD